MSDAMRGCCSRLKPNIGNDNVRVKLRVRVKVVLDESRLPVNLSS